MKRIIKTTIALAALTASYAYAGAQLTVADVTVNQKGQTLSTTCVNSRGFYFEIARPNTKKHLTVYGFGGVMPLKTIMNDLLFKGWRAVFGDGVDTKQKIHWMGHKPWTQWLNQLSFEKNLSIIVDWNNKSVYINRI